MSKYLRLGLLSFALLVTIPIAVSSSSGAWPYSTSIVSNGNSVAGALSNGDIFSSEDGTTGKYYFGNPVSPGLATAQVMVSLPITNSATGGDVLTVTLNGEAIAYTVQGGDTAATIATAIKAAILADGVVGSLVTATCTCASATGDFIILTATTPGYAGQYSLSISNSAGSTEYLALQKGLASLLIPGTQCNYNADIATVIGCQNGSKEFYFRSDGGIVSPLGSQPDFISGNGTIQFNQGALGQVGGIGVYSGLPDNLATSILSDNFSSFIGAVKAEPCTDSGGHCTATPNPATLSAVPPLYLTNTAGTITKQLGSAHSLYIVCPAATSCTVAMPTALPWLSAATYACNVTAEGAADAPYISAKSSSSITFTGSTSVARDAICTGD